MTLPAEHKLKDKKKKRRRSSEGFAIAKWELMERRDALIDGKGTAEHMKMR